MPRLCSAVKTKSMTISEHMQGKVSSETIGTLHPCEMSKSSVERESGRTLRGGNNRLTGEKEQP